MAANSPARLKRLKSRIAAQKRGKGSRSFGIEPPRLVEVAYFKSLEVIVRKLQEQTEAKLFPMLEKVESDYITDGVASAKNSLNGVVNQLEAAPVVLEQTQERIAARMANSVEVFNRGQFIRDINEVAGVSLQGVITKEGVAGDINKSIKTNVELIGKVSTKYHERLRKIIDDGLNKGNDAFSLRKQIHELGGVTERHARFIARDQVAKLNAAVTQARQTRVGITHYFWRTSRDERVRKSHRKKEGNRYAWNDPPSDTGNPGEDYQCRCSAEPDLSGFLKGQGRPQPRRGRRKIVPRVVRSAVRKATVGALARRIQQRRQVAQQGGR